VSFTIDNAWVSTFQTNVRHLAQQTEARFRGCVLEDTIHAEAGFMEQMGPTAARRVTSRHGDSPLMNLQHLRRRIAPYPYDWGDLIDRQDRVRTIIDPDSNYSKAASSAMRRGQDDEIVAAFFGTAYAGHDGSLPIIWPNGNAESVPTTPGGTVVGVSDWTYGQGSGASGLTISKLISAQVALLAAEGDNEEESYLAIGARQLGNLLATTEFTSAEYNDLRSLNKANFNGQTFAGFKLVHSERLQKNASGQTRVVAWRKSGMGLGIARHGYRSVPSRGSEDRRNSLRLIASVRGARSDPARRCGYLTDTCAHLDIRKERLWLTLRRLSSHRPLITSPRRRAAAG
jgi:hypothetical protein